MESAAVFRSFNCTMSSTRSILEKSGLSTVNNAVWPAVNKSSFKSVVVQRRHVVSCVNTSETAVAKTSDSQSQGSLEKKTPLSANFPNGFETLVQDVCDKTEIAELKLKVGEFEMLVRRNIGTTVAPAPVASPQPVAVASETRTESAPAVSSPPPKAPEKISPFTNSAFGKSSKLAALEASGAGAFVLVASPSVGLFRKGRTIKGKKQPPICKEGAIIKEGQVIGYVDQFGTEHPVKSDVAGEVLKVLFEEGEAVGYGDPLLAVLPSFKGVGIE